MKDVLSFFWGLVSERAELLGQEAGKSLMVLALPSAMDIYDDMLNQTDIRLDEQTIARIQHEVARIDQMVRYGINR